MRKNTKQTSDQIQLNTEWQQVRLRLAQLPPSYYPGKAVELLNLCRASPKLRVLKPLISLGRLCLVPNLTDEQLHAEGKQSIYGNTPCLYFHEQRYIASDYDNHNKWPFETAYEAVEFAGEHSAGIPPLEDYTVQIPPSTLVALALHWFEATAHVELRSTRNLISLRLTGVSMFEATRSLPVGETDSVLKIEYNHRQLLMWLSSGNFITISASGLVVERQ